MTDETLKNRAIASSLLGVGSIAAVVALLGLLPDPITSKGYLLHSCVGWAFLALGVVVAWRLVPSDKRAYFCTAWCVLLFGIGGTWEALQLVEWIAGEFDPLDAIYTFSPVVVVSALWCGVGLFSREPRN